MLRFWDGFDHYAAGALAKWTSTSNVTSSAGNGRNATACARISASGSNGALHKTITPGAGSDASGGVGFAVRTNVLFNSAGTNELFQVREGSTVHVSLKLLTTGLIEVYRGTGSGTLLGTTSSGLAVNTYSFLEVKWTIHDTTGAVVVRLNGTQVLSVTGADTRNGGSGVWNAFSIFNGSNNAGCNVDVDDFHHWDISTGQVTDFIGPQRVVTRYPNGAGNSADFTPSAGSNFQNVDEALQDGDTTYNSESTPGDHDTYAYEALGVSGTIKGVQLNMVVRSDGGGAETIAAMARIGGTDYQGTTQGLTTSYTDVMQVYEVSPATGVAFTEAEFDAAEFGLKLVS